MKEKIIGFLLENADPSIVLRVKKEILNNLCQKDEEEFLSKILPQKNVQSVIQSQKPDGWLGNAFHGQSPKQGAGMYDNMEVGLRYLAEKGFPPENEYISKAVNSFLLKEPFDPAYGGKPPKPPDTDYTYTACGLYLARSSIIIRAGYEHKLFQNNFINLKHDIDYSFKTFLNVLNFTDVSEVIDTHRKKPCFKPGVLWPCMYDLRMLAHSRDWRSEKNISLLADSVSCLFSLPHSREEMVYTYIKGQFTGPCFAFINWQFRIVQYYAERITLEIMELFARCGVVNQVEVLKNQYNSLLMLIDENFNVNIDEAKQKNYGWSPYFGFALEENWKSEIKRRCDILFRVLLIIHFTERVK